MTKDEFFSKLSAENNINLNHEQMTACSHFKGPALTLAIPGSGKTTLLVCRTKLLQDVHNVSHDKIISLTFSKAAAREMKNRYSVFFPNSNIPDFSTIHAFSYRIMKAHYNSMQMSMPSLVADSSSGFSQKKLVLESLKTLKKFVPSDTNFDEFINFISLNKNLEISPHQAIEQSSTVADNQKGQVYKAYEELKNRHSLMDFDDMISKSNEILDSNPRLLDFLRRKHGFIQLDEAQDTSFIQHKLLEKLNGPEKNYFLVADDDQSIYGFRGAYPDAIINFDKTFKNPNIFKLSKNYRSSSEIVNICSQFIKSNKNRHDKKMESANPAKGSITMTSFYSIEQRNDSIISNLSNELTGILFRNNVSAISLSHLLISQEIDFEIKDSCSGFFDSRVYRDILDFIEFSLASSDYSSFQRIYYKTGHFITKEAVAFAQNSMENVLDGMLSNKDLKKWQHTNIINLKNNFSKLSAMSPFDGLTHICNQMGYYEYLAKSSKNGSSNIESSRMIIDVLKDISVSYSTHIEFLLGLDKLKKTLINYTKNPMSRLKLTTMHSSKGLEYDRVILIDSVKGTIPSFEALDNAKNGDLTLMEEERRLFYVALSRAKFKLEILNLKTRYGEKMFDSQFIKELTDNKSSKDIKMSDHQAKVAVETSYEYILGRIVRHFKYGDGTILRINSSSVAEILFESGEKKSLSLTICFEKKLLELI